MKKLIRYEVKYLRENMDKKSINYYLMNQYYQNYIDMKEITFDNIDSKEKQDKFLNHMRLLKIHKYKFENFIKTIYLH